MGRTPAGSKPKSEEGDAKFRIHRYKVGLTWSCPKDAAENPIYEELGRETKAVLAAIEQHFQEKYGYTFLMASDEFLEKLRKDPSLRETTWYAEEQRKLEENSIVNKLEEK